MAGDHPRADRAVKRLEVARDRVVESRQRRERGGRDRDPQHGDRRPAAIAEPVPLPASHGTDLTTRCPAEETSAWNPQPSCMYRLGMRRSVIAILLGLFAACGNSSGSGPDGGGGGDQPGDDGGGGGGNTPHTVKLTLTN